MSEDLYLLASEAPGILDGWRGPAGVLERGKWIPGTFSGSLPWARWQDDDPDDPCPDCGDWVDHYADEIRLDFALPEVRDRAVRWGIEHDRRDYSGAGVYSHVVEKLMRSSHWDAYRDSPAALLAEVREVARMMEKT